MMEISKYHFNIKGDERGSLIAIESGISIPFDVKRLYYIFDTKPGVIRGKHAHLKLKQVLICIHGACTIVLDDGIDRAEVVLEKPDEGLFISSLMWREMKDFSTDSVLLVLASEYYDEADYIRDYDEFKRCVEFAKQ